ncbi:MAG: phage holin family protein [Iphinoe sp. HA4291-MV1]|jgi:putative membrane protein|nr:phage holin family protein [Iphinoe sp. HA4291-MV1]
MPAFLTALATALSLLIVDLVVPGVNIDNFVAALVAALVIGFINGSVRPVLSTLSLPLNFLTLGAFSLVVNGICFSLAAFLVPGFQVHGLIAFILGPVVLSFASTLINNYFTERKVLTGSEDAKDNAQLPSS